MELVQWPCSCESVDHHHGQPCMTKVTKLWCLQGTSVKPRLFHQFLLSFKRKHRSWLHANLARHQTGVSSDLTKLKASTEAIRKSPYHSVETSTWCKHLTWHTRRPYKAPVKMQKTITDNQPAPRYPMHALQWWRRCWNTFKDMIMLTTSTPSSQSLARHWWFQRTSSNHEAASQKSSSILVLRVKTTIAEIKTML